MNEMIQYRLRFSKEKELRFLSHLELMRALERAFRRAMLPLAYSEGFHPHPKLSFGPALAVGISSNDEYLDFQLTGEVAPSEIKERLNQTLPGGIRVIAVVKISRHAKPLNALINRAAYSVLLKCDPGKMGEIVHWLKGLVDLAEIVVQRVSKEGQKFVNIRPWLHNLTIKEINGDILEIRLTGEIGSGGNLRPEDITGGIPHPVEILSIARIGLWHEEKGTVLKPLDFTCNTEGDK
ncbi:MAG: TIGR03936 family radical SAM-associated protein [Bacillota bacterium]